MGSRCRPCFDLNEPPADEENVNENMVYVQHQKSHPTLSSNISGRLLPSEGSQRLENNHGFTHSMGSGFQHFVGSKDAHRLKESIAKEVNEMNPNCLLSSLTMKSDEDHESIELAPSVSPSAQTVAGEEEEWSDVEGNMNAAGINESRNLEETGKGETVQQVGEVECDELMSSDGALGGGINASDLHVSIQDDSGVARVLNGHVSSEPEGSKGSFSNDERDVLADCLEETSLVVKPKEIKYAEAKHAFRVVNNLGKRPKLDEQKEAILARKRNRQTIFLDMDEAKQPDGMRSSNTSVAEWIVGRQAKSVSKEQRQADEVSTEGSTLVDTTDNEVEPNGDVNTGLQASSKKVTSRKQTMVDQNTLDIKIGNKKQASARMLSTWA